MSPFHQPVLFMNELTKSAYFRAQVLYWIMAALLFAFLDYWKMLGMRPQGIHFMRQTDSLSIILHYVKNGMHFWEPGILNLESVDGKTASEFPLFYYVLAWGYKLFGEHESWLRFLNTLLIFLGFNGVFRICLLHFRHIVLSLAITFLLWSSMILFYYGNNFLPDASALGLTLCGLYFMYRYIFLEGKTGTSITGMALMTLASLIKVSYFVYPTACVLTLLTFDWFVSRQTVKAIFQKHIYLLLFFVAGVLGILSWIVYIKQYNLDHNGYFLVRSRSILQADAIDRINVLKNITGWWADSYYPTLTKYLMLLIFVVGLARFRQTDLRWVILSLFCIAGAFAFFLLFFLQFRDHDYYFLAMIPAIVIAIIFSITSILEFQPQPVFRFVFTVLLCVVALKGIAFSKQRLWKRFADSRDDLYSIVGQQLDGADTQLDKAGISRDARLILVMDKNVNGGLYFSGRFGWPLMDTNDVWMNRIPGMIENGASHFVMLDTALLHLPMIEAHLGKEVLTTDKFRVFETR